MIDFRPITDASDLNVINLQLAGGSLCQALL
nr:MAG TPA: hypothetical protein [Caudoviricetes sp.]